MTNLPFDEKTLAELRRIHPQGPEIVMARRKNMPVQKVCKKFHAAPRTTKKLVDVAAGTVRTLAESPGVDKLLGTENDATDETIVSLAYRLSRYLGVLRKEEIADWMTNQYTGIMQLATRYDIDVGDPDCLNLILQAARDAAYNDGFVEGAANCKSTHTDLLEKAKASAYSEGRRHGQEHIPGELLTASRNQVMDELRAKGVVPITLAVNLNYEISWEYRELMKKCPYCSNVITLETCNPIGSIRLLTPAERRKFSKLQERTRKVTGEWTAGDPWNLPSWMAWEPRPVRKEY